MKKKKIIASFISVVFIFSLVIAKNLSLSTCEEKNTISIENIEALADGESANTTIYCCSPYTKTCVYGGPVRPDIMGEKKSSPCN